MAHGNLPSASSSSYARNKYYVYDVFLNHRGPDCKESFATDLYNCLRGYGLGVFLDKRELKQGDRIDSQIEGAIRKASVHVAIFSQTYAQSSWCLDELLVMLRSGAPIVPVFYGGVKPSDLRWVEGNRAGPYARDLHKLEQETTFDIETNQNKPRYHQDTVKEWRRALSQAAGISGFEQKKYESEQHRIFPQIAEAVLRNVKMPVIVAKYPIGLDKKVQEFQSVVLLQPPSSETRVLGIVGLGGVGKTTLANEIFNRWYSKYDRCCRLSDISGKTLESSQTKLLRDLVGYSGRIDDIDDGIQKIIQCLPPASDDGEGSPIPPFTSLILLDNVDCIKQRDALLVPVKDSICAGSLILITSRNEDVLENSGLVQSSIYKLKGLNRQYSQELFCMHALHQPNPVEGFESVVAKFLNVCGGLPLSLQVIGASLAGQNELRFWEAQWSKISKTLPREIKDQLKMSYDGLDEEEKQIFLDVACFFIGEDHDTASRICDGCGWNGWLGLRKLQNRCLMEVDSKNLITMHDHVRDLGREIGEKEPPHRLWRPTDHLLYNLSTKEFPVRGIDMDVNAHGYKWPDREWFESPAKLQNDRFLYNMSQLQLLRAEGNYVESILSVVQSPQQLCPPPQLVWLSWRSCPFTSLPSWLPLNKLTVLELKGFHLETPWLQENQAPLQLRELVLRNCSNLRSLPDSFENLTKLEHVDLSWCSNLARLPKGIWKIQSLYVVDLSGCPSFELFPPTRRKRKSLAELEEENKYPSLEFFPPTSRKRKSLAELEEGNKYSKFR